ncbi:MAG: hypothetical protein HXY23_11285 [Parvularculaceae bacterium]|nr:hypothetical protein [Parvularculaceae bacterium]
MTLPPIKAFGAALAYMATHAGELLKATWLPTLLLTAAGVWALPAIAGPMLDLISLGDQPDPARVAEIMSSAGGPIGILFLASLVLYPMIYVAAMRHVLLGQKLRLPFYLQFGAAELRVLATFVLLMILLMLVDIVANLGISALSLAGSAAGPQTGELVSSVLALAYTLFALWLQLRLSLSLPAAIADRRVGLPLSWYKTKGNALRLLAYYILFGLIVLPVAGIVLFLNWSSFAGLYESLQGAQANPAKAAAAVKGFMQVYIDRLTPGHPGFPLAVVFYFLYTLFGVIIGTVPSAIAYRFIVGEPAKA